MKRRIFAALLAGAMILSLTACGGGKDGGGSSSSASGSGSAGASSSTGSSSSSGASSSAGSSSQPDASLPDASAPDASDPAGSQPDASQPDGSGSSSSSGDSSKQPSGQVTLKLNKSKVTLNKAGATFKLRYTTDPETDGDASYTSSDEKVATVDKKGTIKAVAPGTATITVKFGDVTADCAVTCDWKEETQPAPAPDAPKPDTSKPSGGSRPVGSVPTTPTTPTTPDPAPSGKVDLSSFYSSTTGKYEFGSLELADSTILDSFYPGMSGVSSEQMLVYVCPMSMNNGEFGLVQVKDSKDVDAVKKIFQARISYMVGDGNGPGGAQYPAAMDQWEFNSRIVSNGNYVMMIVHENCDDIVSEFNALFK